MKIHRDHGQVLSSALSARGATIIQQSGVLFMAAYHGVDLPLDGYEIREAERAARDVLAAVEAYRKATKLVADEGRCPDCGGSTLLGCHCFEPSAPADPIITWPRPSYHRPAAGIPDRIIPLVRGDAIGMGGSTRFDVGGGDGPEEAA